MLTEEDMQAIRDAIRDARPTAAWWRSGLALLIAALVTLDGAELLGLINLILNR